MKQAGKNYTKRKEAHIAAYQQYFNRVSLDLGSKRPNQETDRPACKGIQLRHRPANGRLVLPIRTLPVNMQFATRRAGRQPARYLELPVRAPWDGKYTTDINVEMNYWPAETTALSEMHEPFLQLVKEVAIQGRESASMYGCRGWTLHHNTDICVPPARRRR